tara:strand:- start:14238 stop:14450 length:213 start_codon:yes stop_codon:yes gene_type:complete
MSWNDERWSADEETLRVINESIKGEEKNNVNNCGEKILLVIAWIIMAPFILRDLFVAGVRWLFKKVKRKN